MQCVMLVEFQSSFQKEVRHPQRTNVYSSGPFSLALPWRPATLFRSRPSNIVFRDRQRLRRSTTRLVPAGRKAHQGEFREGHPLDDQVHSKEHDRKVLIPEARRRRRMANTLERIKRAERRMAKSTDLTAKSEALATNTFDDLSARRLKDIYIISAVLAFQIICCGNPRGYLGNCLIA
jgi:hypothetical protein